MLHTRLVKSVLIVNMGADSVTRLLVSVVDQATTLLVYCAWMLAPTALLQLTQLARNALIPVRIV